MSATILSFPNRRREFVDLERRVDAGGHSTWHFDLMTRDGRRVALGARCDARDVIADIRWFRAGGVRVLEHATFETDLASAISAAFADELVAELQSARSATMLWILKPLRTKCVELLVEFFAKRDDASIDTLIALGAISIAMSVRTIAGKHESEQDVAQAELLVARAAQEGLSRLFAQEGAPTWA